jgi:hypothetical protein
VQTLVIVLGLLLAAAGHVLLHDWRGAVAIYEELDERVPAILRTPAEVAGPLLLACGAACVAAPLLG